MMNNSSHTFQVTSVTHCMPWMTEQMRPSPIPVSTFFFGRGFRVPSGSLLYWVKTSSITPTHLDHQMRHFSVPNTIVMDLHTRTTWLSVSYHTAPPTTQNFTHFPEVIFHPKWKHVVGRGAYVQLGLLHIQVRLKLQFFVASKICNILGLMLGYCVT